MKAISVNANILLFFFFCVSVLVNWYLGEHSVKVYCNVILLIRNLFLTDTYLLVVSNCVLFYTTVTFTEQPPNLDSQLHSK